MKNCEGAIYGFCGHLIYFDLLKFLLEGFFPFNIRANRSGRIWLKAYIVLSLLIGFLSEPWGVDLQL